MRIAIAIIALVIVISFLVVLFSLFTKKRSNTRQSPTTSVTYQNISALTPVFSLSGPPTNSSFELNIRIDNMDDVTFWNQYALSIDHVHAWAPNISYLTHVKTPHKSLTYGKIEDTQLTISLAKENGIEAIDFNREKTNDCTVLIQEEQLAYQEVHQAGRIFYFVPTGKMLQKCYQQYPQLLQNTDAIIYQTEAIQGVDQNYTQTVHTLIQNIKQMKPGIPVWVQVSVNPPSNRNLDAQSVITTIQSLEDGSTGAPDGIQIFAIEQSKDPSRFQVLEQVVKSFRIAH